MQPQLVDPAYKTLIVNSYGPSAAIAGKPPAGDLHILQG
jgi:hypothetical protein